MKRQRTASILLAPVLLAALGCGQDNPPDLTDAAIGQLRVTANRDAVQVLYGQGAGDRLDNVVLERRGDRLIVVRVRVRSAPGDSADVLQVRCVRASPGFVIPRDVDLRATDTSYRGTFDVSDEEASRAAKRCPSVDATVHDA